MADSPSSPATIAPNLKQPDSDKPSHQPDTSASAAPPPPTSQDQRSAPPNPNLNQQPSSASLPPPSIQPYLPPPQPISVPPTAPSYRPVPIPGAPQFSPVQNYQNPAVQPPGVGVSGGVAVTMAPPMMPYPVVPGQVPNMAVRPYAPVPNGYSGLPAHAPV